jgi:alkanesulfonate monooxygenase SsuD/methylene tetrahydromethanopterin reductase-like flavin-dependent oxidoreductase (luciferase family)
MEESMPDSALTLEYLCDQVWIVGSPSTVVRKIRELHSAVGGFGGLLIGATDWSDASTWQRSMDLFAGEVAPGLADLGAPVTAAALS